MGRHQTYELKINDKQIKFNNMKEIAEYLNVSQRAVVQFFKQQPRDTILGIKIEIIKIEDKYPPLPKESNSELAQQKLYSLVADGSMKQHPHYPNIFVAKDGETIITRSYHKGVKEWLYKDRIFAPNPYTIYKRIGFFEFKESTKHIQKYVHQLVTVTWVHNDDPETKVEVNHIDRNKLNNHADNLEWVSHSQNLKHSNVGMKWGRADIKQVRDNLGNDFNSVKEAALFHDVNPIAVSQYLAGSRKTVSGLTFEITGYIKKGDYLRSLNCKNVVYTNIKVWKAIGQGKNARKGEFVGEYETSGSMNKALNTNMPMSQVIATKTTCGYIIEWDRKDET